MEWPVVLFRVPISKVVRHRGVTGGDKLGSRDRQSCNSPHAAAASVNFINCPYRKTQTGVVAAVRMCVNR